MKITFNTPELNAPEEVIEKAIASARSAFLLAMSDEGESSLKVDMVEQSPLNFGHPSEEQLAKMNRLRPMGAPEYKATSSHRGN